MPKVFVFTAGNQAARQHLMNSIEHPVLDEMVSANCAGPHHEELESISEEGNGFYAWALCPV